MADNAAIAEAEMLAEKGYDASDPEQVNQARKKAGRKKKEELDFVSAIMSVPQGRAWMYGLLAACKVFGSPIVQGDPYFTYHNIGEQNIGKKLLQEINDAAPDEYIMMMREAKEK